MGGEAKIPLKLAQQYANRFKDLILPMCKEVIIVGSVRRQVEMVGDVELCCRLFDSEPDILDKFFKDYPGIVMDGHRLKRFKFPSRNLQIELFIPQSHDWGRIVAIRTGSSAFSSYKLAVTWNRMGFCGTSDGLRRKKECEKKGNVWKLKPEYKDNPTLPPIFDTEESFFEFLGIPWVDPIDRSWVSRDTSKNYSR